MQIPPHPPILFMQQTICDSTLTHMHVCKQTQLHHDGFGLLEWVVVCVAVLMCCLLDRCAMMFSVTEQVVASLSELLSVF